MAILPYGRYLGLLKLKFNKSIHFILPIILLIPIFNNGLLTSTDLISAANDSEMDKKLLDECHYSQIMPINTGPLADIIITNQTLNGTVTWTGSNTYIIKVNVTVNGTLEVQQGATVKFDGNYSLIINGTLYVNGTSSKISVFKPNSISPTPGQWGGIQINNNSNGNGWIKFAKIENAINGVYLNNIENFTIESTRIQNTSITGIICNSTNNITIENNSISHNENFAIRLLSANNTTIRYNTLNVNQYGMYLNGSTNNSLTRNSISNRIGNVYDDNNTNSNNWSLNYYGDYSGVDDTGGNFVGDTVDYFIPGGTNIDSSPRTKISNNKDQKTFATISKAVEQSTADMIISVIAETPFAGSQTLSQEGYYYENIVINASVGHDLEILSPFPDGYKNTTIDGNSGTCFEVDGDYELTLGGFAIKNSNTAIYLNNTASNSTLKSLNIIDNINGIVLNDTRDVLIEKSFFTNKVDLNSTAGLYALNSRRVGIIDNRFIENKSGIILESSSAATLINNTCIDNLQGGIWLNKSSQNKLNKNILRSNYNFGIQLTDAHNNNFYDNIIENNLDIGLLLNHSSNNNINNSKINSNSNIGFLLKHSYKNTIFENDIKSNLYFGLKLIEESNNNTIINNTIQSNNNGTKLQTSSYNYFYGNELKANTDRGIILYQNSTNNVIENMGIDTFFGSIIAAIDSSSSQDNMFLNCTIGNMDIKIDINSSIIFLNTFYTGSAEKIDIKDSLSKLTVKHYLTINTINQSSVPIADVIIQVHDKKSNLVIDGKSNADGLLSLIPCVSYIQMKNGKDYSSNNHTISANDGKSEKVVNINITQQYLKVFKFNYFPKIEINDNVTAFEKKFYYSKYNASILENDKTLHWSMSTNASKWLKFSETNLTLYGTPHNRDVGKSWVNVSVRDVDGDIGFHNFTMTVKNTPPEILTKNVLLVYEDDHYFVDYNSSDDDGYLNETGVLIFPAGNLTTWSYSYSTSVLDWLSFNNETGILNGTPTNAHVGTHIVDIFVDDGHGGTNTTKFSLIVENTPPKILTEDKLKAYENEKYYNDYNSSDDGQGKMKWELHTDTEWLSIHTINGTLSGIPRQGDIGEWWVNITVIDDHNGRSFRNFTLEVIDLNQPPQIITKNIAEAYTNIKYEVKYDALDFETTAELLVWGVSNVPEEHNATWLSMDPKTGVLSGTPTIDEVGWYWVNVTVTDSAGAIGFTKFRLDVFLSPNRPPELKTRYDTITKTSSERWIETFSAEDDYTEQVQLIWSLRSNNPWLTINRSTGKIDVQFNRSYVGEYWVNISVTDAKGLFNFTNFTLVIESANHPPFLSNGGVTPVKGSTETEFTFYVMYTDQDNHSGIVWVVIDNKSYLMKEDSNYNRHYYKGVNYTRTMKLGEGVHSFYFTAKDEWGFDAILDSDVPGENSPSQTNDIKKEVDVPFYLEVNFLIALIVIIILVICTLLLFGPSEKYNLVTRYRTKRELELAGGFGYLCPVCRTLVSKDASECDSCGEQFLVEEYICPDCQTLVQGTDEFCPKCGLQFEYLELSLELEEEEEPIVPDAEVEEDEDEYEDEDETMATMAISELESDKPKPTITAEGPVIEPVVEQIAEPAQPPITVPKKQMPQLSVKTLNVKKPAVKVKKELKASPDKEIQKPTIAAEPEKV